MATKHHEAHAHLHGTFGRDRFGVWAERFARFFGTLGFIIGQSIIVAIQIAVNAAVVAFRWDPYPFILLNLTFSTQAAYAAPLTLLAQTRQAARDEASEKADAAHREELSGRTLQLLQENTRLTEEVHRLTEEVHRLVAQGAC